MNSPRRHSREIALKAIYQAEINNSDLNESLNQIVIDSLYSPSVENVVKEFLKSTKSEEIFNLFIMINVLTIISAESSFYLPVDSLSLTRHPDEGEHDSDDGLLHSFIYL